MASSVPVIISFLVILGNRAAPIQVVFSGDRKRIEGLLKDSGFVRKNEMRFRDLFGYVVMTLEQRVQDPGHWS